jgi:hypothetical protein
MPNTRKIQFFMLNDLQIYAKPSQFEPDRFLVKNEKRLRLTLAWSASAFVDGKHEVVFDENTNFLFRSICLGKSSSQKRWQLNLYSDIANF